MLTTCTTGDVISLSTWHLLIFYGIFVDC